MFGCKTGGSTVNTGAEESALYVRFLPVVDPAELSNFRILHSCTESHAMGSSLRG